MAISADDTSID